MMPPDSPPAAPSQLATALAQIAWCDLNRVELDEVPALAIAFDEKLAPVREALSDARTDLAAAVRGFQNNEDAKIEAMIHAKLDAALASLSPQPPEAQT